MHNSIITLLVGMLFFVSLSGCGAPGTVFDPHHREMLRAVKQLDDSDPAVREKAAYKIAYEGWEVRDMAIGKLYDLMKNDESEDVRLAALTILSKGNVSMRNRYAMNVLLGLVEDPSPKIRSKTLTILISFDSLYDNGINQPEKIDLLPEFMPLLNDEDPDVRRAAISAVFDSGRYNVFFRQQAPEGLVAMLDDEDESVRSRAAWMLAGYDDVPLEIIEIFIGELDDPLTMIAAIKSLAVMGPDAIEAAPYLLETIDGLRQYHLDVEVITERISYDAALDLLEAVSLNSIIQAQLELLKPDEIESQVRISRYHNSFLLYWNNGKQDHLAYEQYSETYAFTQAIRALVSIGFEEEASNEIRDIISGEYDKAFKRLVIVALQREHFPQEFATAELVRFLELEDRDLREVAVYSISRIGSDAGDAAYDVLKLLNDEDAGVRYNAAMALGSLFVYSDEIWNELVVTADTDSNPEVRKIARESYEKLSNNKEAIQTKEEQKRIFDDAVINLDSVIPEVRVQALNQLDLQLVYPTETIELREKIINMAQEDESDDVRLAALENLYAKGLYFIDTEFLDIVFTLMEDENPDIRAITVKICGHFIRTSTIPDYSGPDMNRLTSRLEGMLNDADSGIRKAAMQALYYNYYYKYEGYEQPAPSRLTELLGDPDTAVRIEAAMIIAIYADPPTETIQVLVEALDYPLKILDAMTFLQRFGPDAAEAIPKLYGIIENVPVERHVAELLPGKMSADDAIEILKRERPDSILLARIEDEHPLEVEVMHSKGRNSSIVFTSSGQMTAGYWQAQYSEEHVFVSALRLLMVIGEEEKVDEVINDVIVGDYPLDLQQYVINSLTDLDFPPDFALPILLIALESDARDLKEAAILNLGKIGSPAKETIPAIVELLDDADDGIRFNAAKALGNIGIARDDIIRKLKDMAANDPNPEVRRIAGEAITQLKGQ